MPTDKILITNDAGEQVEATAPVIISASRSTDIPAFMPNGSSIAWLKVIALGTILLTSKNVYLFQELQSDSILDKESKTYSTLFAYP